MLLVRRLIASETDNARIAEHLLQLTQGVFDENRLVAVDTVIESLCRLLGSYGHFDFVFHEVPRFAAKRSALFPGLILFNYYSFSMGPAGLERFASPEAVEARVAADIERGFKKSFEGKKVSIFTSSENTISTENWRLASLLVTAQYYLCGGHANFSSNMSKRKISELLVASDNASIEESISIVAREYGALVCIGDVTDHREAPAFYHHGFDIDKTLIADPIFRHDLTESIRQSNARFGSIQGLGHYYICTVARQFYVLSDATTGVDRGDEKISPLRSIQSHRLKCIVLYSSSAAIDLDITYLFNLVCNNLYLHDLMRQREAVLTGFQVAALEAERDISIAPLENRNGIERYFREGIQNLCEGVLGCSSATMVCYYVLDPTDEVMTPYAFVGGLDISGRLPISLRDQGSLIALTARNARGLSAPEAASKAPCWLAKDNTLSQPGNFSWSDRPSWARSVVTLPVMEGQLCHGVLMFAAPASYGLSGDLEYFEIAAHLIESYLRRVTSANDSAWLSRLSFLHSARHEIKNIVSPIRRYDSNLADRLEYIVAMHSGLANSHEGGPDRFLSGIVRDCLASLEMTDVDIDLTEVESVVVPANMAGVCFQSMYAILENARKYEGNLKGSLTFRKIYWGAPRGYTDVLYESPSFTNDLVGSRVFISPIPDKLGSGFRFGLFLAACQIRMIGGEARLVQGEKNPTGEFPFAVRLRLPFSPARD